MVKLMVLALSATLCCVAANPKRSSHSTLSTCERNCDLDEYDCIRGRFSLNKHCSVRDNDAKAPKRFTVRKIQYDAPPLYISIVDYNTIITGLDKCKIVEYCYNKTSGNQVSAISCPSLCFESNRTVLQHVAKMEDKVYQFKITTTYTHVILTTIRNMRNGWDLCTSHTATYIPEKQPNYELHTNDAAVRDLVKNTHYPPGVLGTQLFYKAGSLLATKYINSVFCDFQCN